MSKAFNENLSIILDEIQLSKMWGSASLIFTVHKSIFSQQKTKKHLNKKLKELGYRVIEFEFNKMEGNFIDYLLHYLNDESVVFYFSNIAQGGRINEKDAYTILNIHRETFIERKVAAIFFLTLREASSLPHYAPDFWAFRHRVLEFMRTKPRTQKKPPVGIMLWHLEQSYPENNSVDKKLSELKKLLETLPDQPEAVGLRVDILYELGYLSWREGDLLGAEKFLEAGMDFARASNLIDAKAKLANGLAIICYDQNKYQEAIALLEPTVRSNSEDCRLTLNEAISLFAVNKRYIAMKKAEKATRMCALNAVVWNSLGFLYFFAGMVDEARQSFQKAIDISPKEYISYEALAVCYLSVGRQDLARRQLDQAQQYSTNRMLVHDILKNYIEDKQEKAVQLAKDVMIAGGHSKLIIIRDPIINSLLDINDVA